MRILVLGGTIFVGRHLVARALARGHEVTLFHRGQHGPELFPGAHHILGDRATDLDRLKGQSWDAVVDTCGYVPRITRASAQALAGAVGHYTFISTVSVYRDMERGPVDESCPLAELEDPSVEEVNAETYGGLKVASERAVDAEMPGRTLILRPGLIVGPYDPTDRFTWWPVRVAKGGEVLAPGRPEGTVQFVDVRDLADFTVRQLEAQVTGVYNVTGPRQPLGMGAFLQACKRVSQSDAEFTWVDEALLLAEEVAPYTEMPLWVPEEMAGFSDVDSRRAQDAGLTYRPLEDTIAATLAFASEKRGDRPWKTGLSAEREKALLFKWNHRRPAGAPASPLPPA